MNLKEEMIIIDGKIVTKDIEYCKYDLGSNTYKLKYKNNNKFYNYSKQRLKMIKHGKLLDLNDYNFFINHKRIQNIKEIYEFADNNDFYYHVILKDHTNHDYNSKELIKISKNSFKVIEYMQKVSSITSLVADNGKKLLCEQMQKIEVDSLDNALANYLKLSDNLSKENDVETLIFPFGCNSSQYDAVENAIYNKISVVEGPPGTGKTQTILNIIANIIVRGMNCQVVSNNNPAIKNIEEKLSKYDLNFFVALLGRKKNKDLFFENQNKIIPKFENLEGV